MELSNFVQLAREIQGTKEWNAASILRLASTLAVKANKIENMTGTEKTTFICKIISQLLQEVEEKEKSEDGRSDEDKKAITVRYDKLQKMVEEVLPVSLELLVSAARGKMDLKKVSPSCWRHACSCFATSAVAVLSSQDVLTEKDVKKIESVVSVAEIVVAVDPKEFVVENRMLASQSVVLESISEEKKETAAAAEQETSA